MSKALIFIELRKLHQKEADVSHVISHDNSEKEQNTKACWSRLSTRERDMVMKDD